MERVPFVPFVEVESSNVRAIGYDADAEHLYVQFKKTGLYRYENVPGAVYRSFLVAPSKGQFVWQRLRDNYPYLRIG